MTLTTAALIEAIETSPVLIPAIPGFVERPRIDGILVRATTMAHPISNMVGGATLSSATADAAIQRVKEFFAARDQPFSWLVGSLSTPADLSSRLAAAGFVKIVEMAGMAKTELLAPLPTNPDVEVLAAGASDLDLAADTMAATFPLPRDLAKHWVDMFWAAREQMGSASYLAYIRGNEEPAGFSNMYLVNDDKIAVFLVAAVRDEQRGRGVYRTMVAKRLAEAARKGAEAVVIQAIRTTSAPICEKVGFVELCGLELHAWMPAASA